MIKLAIVGSRNYKNYDQFKTHVLETLKEWKKTIDDIEAIFSGGAPGADTLAEQFAKEYNLFDKMIIFHADWAKYGSKVGPKRNPLIITPATHVIAFPSIKGKGTQHSISIAEKQEKILKKIWIDV